MGFFDIANRYAAWTPRTSFGEDRRDGSVATGIFRARLAAVHLAQAGRGTFEVAGGPKALGRVLAMFKAIVLCELYNLSDDQVEYQLRDRLSFMRFVGFGLEDKVPDAKTVWL